MNRISLAIFDSDNTLAFSTTKNASVDEDFSEPISCSLLPGDYRFVAVIHQANDANEVAATIASTAQATITTSKLLKAFAVNQPVAIIADQTNTVSIDLGSCITSKFQLKTTDDTPANVASCEVILNPSSSATAAYLFNPTTGFSDNIVRTRTFTDVLMESNRITRATGSFFHSAANSSFTHEQLDLMRAFLQGAVYCWCKNRKDEWFAARDLFGGDNYYWQGTPLISLYGYYLNGDEENHDYAVEEAGKAAGRLLKEVLIDDKRTF